MTFTSYAQNFEDVMLWRALKHIEHGCYVDVGAQHPVIDSVSKAFYDRGWRGTHIEPVPQYAELLRKDRPDETVLQIALADVEGTIELNVIPETGLSTAVDAYAKRHQEERLFGSQQITVSAMPLKFALRSLEGKAVHWLKIDVEGFETQVLKGWDSQSLRPWVMVVEATIPGSAETDYADWDEIIVAANYQFVYFDGLNRFYIAREHAELAAAFLSPPNVFDDIKLTENSSLCSELVAAYHARMLQDARRIARAEAHAAQAEAHAVKVEAQAEAHAAQAAAHAAQIEAQLRDMLNSSSWRITAPLRNWVSVLRKIKLALKTGTLVPAIKRRFKNRLSQLEAVVGQQKPYNLSPRAERIYAELKNATELEKINARQTSAHRN
jgi:FkbM family methyltransferase